MYLKNGAAWNTKIIDTVTTNIDQISSLLPNTTYKWRVKIMCSSNGSNNSSWTSWQYFTTSNTNRIISDDVETSINLNIYPNPSSGIFNISFISEKLNSFRITITDTYGKIIFNDKSIDFIGEYTRFN